MQDPYSKKNPWWKEFVSLYEGDPSVGIWKMTSEEARNELLKDANTQSDRVFITRAYNRMKQFERAEAKQDRRMFLVWKRENPKLYKKIYGNK